MKKYCCLWAFVVLFAGVLSARADSEIVVANRYLLANRTSHSHLYLYREDGKLLRQLTSSNAGQDRDPIFAPDGQSIVWTRLLSNGEKQYWSIRPRGSGLKQLRAQPAWYKSTHTSNFFSSNDVPDALRPASGNNAPRVRTPDGRWEMVLRELTGNENEQDDGEGHGSHYLLRDLKTGTETEFGKLPGFFGVYDLLQSKNISRTRFLWEKNLHLAFFDLHLDSTNGDTVSALDFDRQRLVRLSPNWAAPILLPGESAFLSFTENRYVPIPGTNKTANCCFIERFDAHLRHTRYARTNCTVCYGASMYRPGQTPRIVTVRACGA
jgi:hypothetical protein